MSSNDAAVFRSDCEMRLFFLSYAAHVLHKSPFHGIKIIIFDKVME